MKKFFLFLIIFLLVVAGAGYLLFPTIEDQLAQQQFDALKGTYRRRVAAMGTESITEALEAAAAYNAEKTEASVSDVFSHPENRATRVYANLLNVADGVIGFLEIPKIQVSLPVYHTATDKDPDRTLIHVFGSSLPSDAAGAHVVIAGPGAQKADGFFGSIGLTAAQMLQNLDRVTPGDLLILRVLDRTMVYQVEGTQILTAEALDTRTEPETDLLTVVTERDSRRLSVQARRIRIAEAGERLNQEDWASELPYAWNILALGSPVLLLGLIVMWIVERFKKHSYRLPVNPYSGQDEEGKEN